LRSRPQLGRACWGQRTYGPQAPTELSFAYVGIANQNEAAIRFWMERSTRDRSGSSLPGRERTAGHCALPKIVRRSESVDRTTTPADLIGEADARLRKLTEENFNKKILRKPLETDSAFSN